MVKEKLLEAHAHIKAGEYEQARKILIRLNHPRAQEWLRKVNEKLLEDDPFNDDFTGNHIKYHPEVKKPLDATKIRGTPNIDMDGYFRKQTKAQTYRKPSRILTGAVMIMAIIVISAMLMITSFSQQSIGKTGLTREESTELYSVLVVICEYDFGYSEDTCKDVLLDYIADYPLEFWACYEPYKDDDRWASQRNRLTIWGCVENVTR
jgi:hypothetical protein